MLHDLAVDWSRFVQGNQQAEVGLYVIKRTQAYLKKIAQAHADCAIALDKATKNEATKVSQLPLARVRVLSPSPPFLGHRSPKGRHEGPRGRSCAGEPLLLLFPLVLSRLLPRSDASSLHKRYQQTQGLCCQGMFLLVSFLCACFSLTLLQVTKDVITPLQTFLDAGEKKRLETSKKEVCVR